jgi:undecaprenyl-diphosphatase
MTNGHRGGLRRATGRVLGRILLSGAVIYMFLVAVGLLLAHPLAGITSVEDGVDRELAGERSPFWDTVTGFFSALANTPAVIGAGIVIALALRLIYGRWRESIILVTAVCLQAVTFLLTTLVIDRPRPAVPPMDPAPPTSSFPSGHTGAATALYVGLAVVIAWRLRHRWLKVTVVTVLVAVPVLVAVSRLYRGMHHPTDVVFGALNGLACVTVAVRALLPEILHRGARTGHAITEWVGHFQWAPIFRRDHDESRSSPTRTSPSAAASRSSES